MQEIYELFTTYGIDTDFLGLAFVFTLTMMFLLVTKTLDILGGK